MLSRRSVLAFLGLAPIAPIAAPAALASAGGPAIATFGADVTVHGTVVAAGPVVTPRMIKAALLRAYNEMTAAELEAMQAALPQAHGGRFLPCTWPGPSGSGPFAGGA